MKIHKLKSYYNFWKRVWKYGLRYYFSQEYRHKIRNKEKSKRDKIYYGSFTGNRRSLKKWLFENRGNKCFWCGEVMKWDTATIDHIVPICKNHRDNSKKNLRLIHDECRVVRDKMISRGELITN